MSRAQSIPRDLGRDPEGSGKGSRGIWEGIWRDQDPALASAAARIPISVTWKRKFPIGAESRPEPPAPGSQNPPKFPPNPPGIGPWVPGSAPGSRNHPLDPGIGPWILESAPGSRDQPLESPPGSRDQPPKAPSGHKSQIFTPSWEEFPALRIREWSGRRNSRLKTGNWGGFLGEFDPIPGWIFLAPLVPWSFSAEFCP